MISREQLRQIGQLISNTSLSEEVIAELRGEFPDHHFTYCQDDDVMAAPVYESEGFNLYLVDSSSHCLSFTKDMEVATGVVVAEIEEE